jgi:hypothetical protein
MFRKYVVEERKTNKVVGLTHTLLRDNFKMDNESLHEVMVLLDKCDHFSTLATRLPTVDSPCGFTRVEAGVY